MLARVGRKVGNKLGTEWWRQNPRGQASGGAGL